MKGVEAGPWSWSISGSFLVVVTDSLGFISRNFFGPQILYLKMSNVFFFFFFFGGGGGGGVKRCLMSNEKDGIFRFFF